MNSHVISSSLCIFAGFFLSINASYADVILKMESEANGQAKMQGEMFVSGKNIRIKQHEGRGEQEILFRGQNQELITIDSNQKRYVQLSKEDLRALADKANVAFQQIDQQLKGLPPEQRAMMQQMMAKSFPGGVKSPVQKTEIRRSGVTRTVAGHKCEQYDVYRGNDKTSEYCVADPSSFHGGAEVRAALESMGEFFKGFIETLSSGPMASIVNNPYVDISKVEGIPVETVQFEGGSVKRRTVITESKQEPVDGSTFSVPSTFTRFNPLAEMKF
ncbi:MAG: DUF3617 family protein [Bdellovibrionales bacterium]|nr:DUF3617 family protein [Bdellovibrionales bacterium]